MVKHSFGTFFIFRHAVKWLALGWTIVCFISHYGSLSFLTKMFHEFGFQIFILCIAYLFLCQQYSIKQNSDHSSSLFFKMVTNLKKVSPCYLPILLFDESLSLLRLYFKPHIQI
jgi:4-hydroxybenzoate polyprenyltransferase